MPGNILQAPRSRWGFATPSKGLLEYETKQGMRQQLLQEASSLVPDYQSLTDTLMKNDLHYADAQRVRSVLDQYTEEYLNNYRSNPFYSFSRDARNLSKAMQSVVNSPTLRALSQQYSKDKARWEQADKDSVTPMTDVNELGIKTLTSDGKVIRKRTLDRGDTPLTIDDSYHYVSNIVGGSGGGFNYDMSSDQDLLNNLDKAFQNIGEDRIGRDLLDEGQRVVQSGNNRQVNSRIDWLKQQGLSQSNLNRIYAEYFKKSGDYNMDAAKKYAIQYVNNYASGVRESSNDQSYFPEARKGSAEASAKQVQLPTTYTSAILGSEGKRAITLQTPAGSVMVGEGNILTNDIFKDAPKIYTEDGQSHQSHRLMDLDVFRKAISNGAYVPVAVTNKDAGVKAGDFANLDQSAVKEMVISETDPPSLQVMIVDKNNKPANADDVQRLNATITSRKAIPEDLKKYFDVNDGVPTLRRGYFLHGTGLVPRRRGTIFGGTINEDKKASDQLTDYGHNSVDDDLTRQEYNQYSGKDTKAGSSWIGFDDQIYKVDVLIPVTNSEIFMGDKVRGTQDALLMGDSSRLQDPSVPVDRAYLGLAPFNQVQNPNNYLYFPR